MFKELFSNAILLDLPLVAMAGFMALFIGVVIWACSSRRGEHFDEMSRMPLDDGNHTLEDEAR